MSGTLQGSGLHYPEAFKIQQLLFIAYNSIQNSTTAFFNKVKYRQDSKTLIRKRRGERIVLAYAWCVYWENCTEICAILL